MSFILNIISENFTCSKVVILKFYSQFLKIMFPGIIYLKTLVPAQQCEAKRLERLILNFVPSFYEKKIVKF